MERLAFGELELSILKIVRALEKATVREVYEGLGSSGSYTTIMTVMSRLFDKGDLKREKRGKQYVYWTSELENLSSESLFKRIQKKIFGEKPLAVLSYLLGEEAELSENDLQEIEKLIEKRRMENKNHE